MVSTLRYKQSNIFSSVGTEERWWSYVASLWRRWGAASWRAGRERRSST